MTKQRTEVNGIGMHSDINLMLLGSAEPGNDSPVFDSVFRKCFGKYFSVAPAVLAENDRSLYVFQKWDGRDLLRCVARVE